MLLSFIRFSVQPNRKCYFSAFWLRLNVVISIFFLKRSFALGWQNTKNLFLYRLSPRHFQDIFNHLNVYFESILVAISKKLFIYFKWNRLASSRISPLRFFPFFKRGWLSSLSCKALPHPKKFCLKVKRSEWEK